MTAIAPARTECSVQWTDSIGCPPEKPGGPWGPHHCVSTLYANHAWHNCACGTSLEPLATNTRPPVATTPPTLVIHIGGRS